MYFQDNQDCNSSTFKLRVQDNRDFSGTLLQDLCVTTTQDCTGTLSQDFCGQDTSEFTSKPDHTYRAQGAPSGFVEPSTVAVLTSSTNTCDLKMSAIFLYKVYKNKYFLNSQYINYVHIFL